MNRPILYSFRRCPYAMRARLAISSSGQQTELREILLRDKAPDFLETSPKGTVPVLLLTDGTVIDESIDVMDWALSQSDPMGLLPNDQAKDMREIVLRSDAEFKPYLDRYKYPNKFDDCGRDTAIEKATLFLNELDMRLENAGFLFGNTRSFADIGIAPFVRQYAHVDRVWFMNQPYKNLIRWYVDFTNWDGFFDIMNKYPKWVAGDEITVFPKGVSNKVTANASKSDISSN